jgi:hypothetical protein
MFSALVCTEHSAQDDWPHVNGEGQIDADRSPHWAAWTAARSSGTEKGHAAHACELLCDSELCPSHEAGSGQPLSGGAVLSAPLDAE